MATYIEDEETSKLVEEFAAREGKTKTGALRDLLRSVLSRPKERSAEQRYQDALAFIHSFPPSAPVKQADIDGLYEYLDAD